MQSLSKPYGVFGPHMIGKDNRILTVDFTHKLHMEIFNMNYYPPELIGSQPLTSIIILFKMTYFVSLVDWWMDDWISIVYGLSRTFRSKNIRVRRERTINSHMFPSCLTLGNTGISSHFNLRAAIHSPKGGLRRETVVGSAE